MTVDVSKLTPVLLGADLNCYNVVRAFHEEYGIKSYAFGRYASAPTKYSSLIHFTPVEHLDTDDVMLDILTKFRDEHAEDNLILFACNDEYSDVFARIKDKLPEYTFPYPKLELRGDLSRKAEFSDICDKYGVPHPATVVFNKPAPSSDLSEEALGFSYPVVIKPSSSIKYWQHPFEGMDKVFFSKNPEESEKIIEKIFASGYDDKIVVQETIAGGDSQMRVLTCFSDANAKVRAVCLGNTMVEEHVPSAIGNHAAIVTEPVSNFPQMQNIINMLEDIGYVGFSNFDMKLREGTDDDFSVFEINLRQGRSNYYMTGSGLNVAKLAVEKFNDTDHDDCIFCENEHFWHHVPKAIAFSYCESPKLLEKAKELDRSGNVSCSLLYKPDLGLNFKRRFMVWAQMFRQYKKFRDWYPTKNK